MSTQTEAQRIAELLEVEATVGDMGRKPDPNSNKRKAAAELRRLEAANAELLEALNWAYNQTTKHDERLPFDWALYCEALHMAIKKHGGAA